MAIVKTIRNIDVNSYRTEDIGIVKLDLNIARLFAPAKQEKNTSFQLILCDSANDILYSSLSDGASTQSRFCLLWMNRIRKRMAVRQRKQKLVRDGKSMTT